jgi:hypothetical protein
VLAALAAHLTLVVWGAGNMPSLPDGPVAQALRWYSALSGADGSFGFFSPGVPPQYRAQFTLVGKDGRTWTDTLERGGSHEARLRLSGIADKLFPLDPEERPPDFQRTLTASWAAALFARHPEASRVVVRVEAYEVPSLADYQGGARLDWETIYEVTFTRTGADPED